MRCGIIGLKEGGTRDLAGYLCGVRWTCSRFLREGRRGGAWMGGLGRAWPGKIETAPPGKGCGADGCVSASRRDGEEMKNGKKEGINVYGFVESIC